MYGVKSEELIYPQKTGVALSQIRPRVLGRRCAYRSSRKKNGHSGPCCGGILALALHLSTLAGSRHRPRNRGDATKRGICDPSPKGEVGGGRSFLQGISPVAQDKENERRVLDVFSGTGRVTKGIKNKEFHGKSLDMNCKFDAFLCIEILDRAYQKYPKGYFEIVAASPPCTEFSRAKTRGVRNSSLRSVLSKGNWKLSGIWAPKDGD